mgnify:CR=1 FL=1
MPVVVSSLLIGMVFGAGLAISQMMNPAKVLGFLDFAGNWDPTLGFVMAGALVAAIPGFLLAKKGKASLLGGPFRLPTRRDIDSPLVAGAAIFGVGWGLVGFCPGPALAALGSGLWEVFVFVAAMIAGMLLFRILPVK